MNKEKNTDGYSSIGLSTLLVIFFVLCLTTFALLALSSAKNDYALSEKLAQHRREYYEVTSEAECILSNIDQALETDYHTLVSQPTFYIDDVCIHVDTASEEPILRYRIPFENGQQLSVELALHTSDTGGYEYEILTWQVIE